MRFDQLLQSLDMGRCQDQQERQALLSLAILFVAIDGDIDESEEAVLAEWMKGICWSSDVGIAEYYQSSMQKCLEAINDGEFEDYISHHARLLVDNDAKQQALTLAEKIANADGVLDSSEAHAIAILRSELSS